MIRRLKASSAVVVMEGSQLTDGLEGFEDLGNLLGALGGLLAEPGGEGFRILAVGGDEFLNGRHLGGQGGGPGEGGGGFFGFGGFRRFGAVQFTL